MKYITLIALCLCFGMFGKAQEVSNGTVQINKANQPCVVAGYNVSEDVLSSALESRLSKSNAGKSSKVKGGFRAYKGVLIKEISQDKVDIYTKIDEKKGVSTLYFLVSRGYDNFISAESDPEMNNAVKEYVSGLVNYVNISKLKYDIEQQEKVVDKADKNVSSMEKEGKKLEDELKSVQKKIEENKEAQMKAKNEWEKEKGVLEELKNKLSDIQ